GVARERPPRVPQLVAVLDVDLPPRLQIVLEQRGELGYVVVVRGEGDIDPGVGVRLVPELNRVLPPHPLRHRPPALPGLLGPPPPCPWPPRWRPARRSRSSAGWPRRH